MFTGDANEKSGVLFVSGSHTAVYGEKKLRIFVILSPRKSNSFHSISALQQTAQLRTANKPFSAFKPHFTNNICANSIFKWNFVTVLIHVLASLLKTRAKANVGSDHVNNFLVLVETMLV